MPHNQINTPTPTDATVAVTYKCNSKCNMCNIWQRTTNQEIDAEVYSKLPTSLNTINLTGGEPFLIPNLYEIVKVFHDLSDPRMVISSNGFLTKSIESQMQYIHNDFKKVGVGISIDGIGKTHDKIRGIPGGFKKAIKTVEVLKDLGIKDLRIAMTVGDSNANEIEAVYDLSNELGVEFSLAVVHNSDVYFKKDNNKLNNVEITKNGLETIMKKEFKTRDSKRWFRGFFYQGLINKITGNTKRILNCDAGESFFFLDPYGNLYPCNILDKPFGNIVNTSFNDLWVSKKGNEIRKFTNTCPMNCWMVCTAKATIQKNLLSILPWIAKKKLQNLF